MYYGSERLGKKQTSQIPGIKDIKPSIKESKKYDMMFPGEKLVFEMSELKQGINDSKSVFALILIKYPSLSKVLIFFRLLKSKF